MKSALLLILLLPAMLTAIFALVVRAEVAEKRQTQKLLVHYRIDLSETDRSSVVHSWLTEPHLTVNAPEKGRFEAYLENAGVEFPEEAFVMPLTDPGQDPAFLWSANTLPNQLALWQALQSGLGNRSATTARAHTLELTSFSLPRGFRLTEIESFRIQCGQLRTTRWTHIGRVASPFPQRSPAPVPVDSFRFYQQTPGGYQIACPLWFPLFLLLATFGSILFVLRQPLTRMLPERLRTRLHPAPAP